MTKSGVHVRQVQNQPAFILSRYAARDSQISMIGFRLYVYLHTHQEGYLLTFNQIKKELGLGRDGIRSAIKNLTELGYLKVEQTRKEDNSFVPLSWQLLDPNSPTDEYLSPGAGSPPAARPETAEATPIDNNKNKITNNKKTSSEDRDQLFEVFWQSYPKKPPRQERKQDALKAFKSAMNRTTFEDILAGVEAYKLRHNGYPLLAHNWLKNDGWEDAAATPTKSDGFWGGK